MHLEDKKVGNILVIKILDDRLDAISALSLKKQLLTRIHDGEKTIVLNLSTVDFIDSSGLGAIVTIHKALGKDGDMVISGPNDEVLNMFKLTRLEKLFHIMATDDEAVKLLTEKPPY